MLIGRKLHNFQVAVIRWQSKEQQRIAWRDCDHPISPRKSLNCRLALRSADPRSNCRYLMQLLGTGVRLTYKGPSLAADPESHRKVCQFCPRGRKEARAYTR